ncbi:hypothetical protein F4778DRAFT_727226 [Xylariomycetidae sp. FL2044]|nr:hypothetical protein F4778DRAFT_727226 [Xylariomycetidae sp. FL2044]
MLSSVLSLSLFPPFSALLALLLLLLLLSPQQAAADFWIYKDDVTTFTGLGTQFESAYAFLNHPPNQCSEVVDHVVPQHASSDVSGNKHGVRCQGCGDDDHPDPKVIEFNNAIGHFTAYADRDWELVDTAGNQVGQCYKNTSMTYGCRGPASTEYGRSLIWCAAVSNADPVNQ